MLSSAGGGNRGERSPLSNANGIHNPSIPPETTGNIFLYWFDFEAFILQKGASEPYTPVDFILRFSQINAICDDSLFASSA
jgi:hypothetical protein